MPGYAFYPLVTRLDIGALSDTSHATGSNRQVRQVTAYSASVPSVQEIVTQ